MEILLDLRLRELTSKETRSLTEIMDEIGAQGEIKGLTAQMVESMLRDE